MRFEYDPEDGPDMATAEALQQIAVQLERIADASESDNDLDKDLHDVFGGRVPRDIQIERARDAAKGSPFEIDSERYQGPRFDEPPEEFNQDTSADDK